MPDDRGSLFARLLGMAFERMTGTAPVIVTVGAAPSESRICFSGWPPSCHGRWHRVRELCKSVVAASR